jgi:hypothetical protein
MQKVHRIFYTFSAPIFFYYVSYIKRLASHNNSWLLLFPNRASRPNHSMASFEASMMLFKLCKKKYTDQVGNVAELLLEKNADPLVIIEGTTALSIARLWENQMLERMMVFVLAKSGRCGFCGESCLMSLL